MAMWSWTELKSKLTPGLLKALGIILFIDAVSISGTIYSYLALVNLYELIEETTTFVKTVAFITTFLNLPISFVLDYFFKIAPSTLMPGFYLVKGSSLLAYGLVMYQESWSPWFRLGLGYVVTLPMHYAASIGSAYMGKHLVIALAKEHDVKLGVLNSVRSILGATTHAVQILIVGQIYLALSLEDATLYMTAFGFLLTLGMAFVSKYLFAAYSAIPKRKASPVSVLSNLKVQMDSFWNCKIYKILLSQVLDTASIGGTYVTLFMLGAGLGEVTMTYMAAIGKVTILLACILNVIKYKYSWGTRYADCFVFGHFTALFNCIYIFSAWLYVAWFPWLRGEEVPDEVEEMPTWMVVYFVINLSIGWMKGTMMLIKTEFFQEMIPPEDRGSIAGVKIFLSLLIMIVWTTMNLLLPDEYVYVVNFSITVITDLVTLAVVVSYKMDEMVERRKGLNINDVEDEYGYEKVPLTAHFEDGDKTVLFEKRIPKDFEN